MTCKAQRRVATILISVGALSFAGLAPGASPTEQGHDHGHATDKPLAPGKRWQTDAPLCEGMTHIRQIFEPKQKAVHKNKLTPDQYKELATRTEAEIGHIVANCKLAPDADAALHGILAQIGEGTAAMAGKSKLNPREGAIKVVAALDEYGRTFEHSGWKRLPH